MIVLNNSIEEKVLSIIEKVTEIGKNELSGKLDLSIASDLGIDSLDRIDIVNSIEEAFRLVIPDEVVKKMDTITSIIIYVKEHGRN